MRDRIGDGNDSDQCITHCLAISLSEAMTPLLVPRNVCFEYMYVFWRFIHSSHSDQVDFWNIDCRWTESRSRNNFDNTYFFQVMEELRCSRSRKVKIDGQLCWSKL